MAVRLTAKSKIKVSLLYFAFTCTLVLNLYCVGLFFGDFRRYWRDQELWIVVSCLVFFYLNLCLYVCSGFILISPIMQLIWPKIQMFLPWRIRRRTWIFCNCSCKSLVRIITTIHDTQCTTTPSTAETLDTTTKHYIHLVQDSCRQHLDSPDMDFYLVGSSAEGLGRPYTLELQKGYVDPAMKFALRFFCCCLPCSTSYSSLRTDYDIILRSKKSQRQTKQLFEFEFSEQSTLGFTKLKLLDNTIAFTMFSCMDNGTLYLSSQLVRKAVRESIESTSESQLPASRIFGPIKHMPIIELEEKGPAVKLVTYPLGQAWYWNEDQRFVTFEGDFVFGFHCMMPLPDITKAWITRPRLWPHPEDIKSITEAGFILVPKSDTMVNDSGNEGNEWHVTFPHSEGYILRKCPKVAKACYLAMKLILKNHLVFYFEHFKTYYLKTMFLWELEKHPESFWHLDNIDECFYALFDHVFDAVRTQRCPYYCIDGVDFFQQLQDKNDLVVLSGVLLKIRTNPSPYIEDIGSMWC